MAAKQHKPKDWREVGLMLTALLPIHLATRIMALVPPVPAIPNWLNEIIAFVCWVPLCAVFVLLWARLLHLLKLLSDEQMSRYPFGLGAGRD